MKPEKKRRKANRWIVSLAVLTVLVGCIVAMMVVYRWFPGLPGTLESRINLENLTQVVVPGSEEVTFDKNGAYAVYYEHRSVVNGVAYNSGVKPPDLICTLTSKTSGAELAVVPDYVETNTYSTKDRARVGVLMGSIRIGKPGAYRLACRYPDGKSQPQVALAIGPNLAWEFLSIAVRTLLTAAMGLVVLAVSGAAALVMVVVIAVRRRRSSTAIVRG